MKQSEKVAGANRWVEKQLSVSAGHILKSAAVCHGNGQKEQQPGY